VSAWKALTSFPNDLQLYVTAGASTTTIMDFMISIVVSYKVFVVFKYNNIQI